MNKILYIICLLSLCSSCQLSNDSITNHWWKSGDGNAGLSDVIHFKKGSYKLRNDTIFKAENAVAVITKKEIRFYAGNILTVKSLVSNKTGTFYEQ